MDGHDTCAAGTSGEVLCFETAGENGVKAGICEAFVGSIECVDGRVADGHAKALRIALVIG
jgi:hypothetical protein